MPATTATPAHFLNLGSQANNDDNNVCYSDTPNAWWLRSVLTPNDTSSNTNQSSNSPSRQTVSVRTACRLIDSTSRAYSSRCLFSRDPTTVETMGV